LQCLYLFYDLSKCILLLFSCMSSLLLLFLLHLFLYSNVVLLSAPWTSSGSLTIKLYMHSSSPPWSGYSDNVWWRVQITSSSVQVSPVSCHIVSPLEPSILLSTLFPNTLIELRGRVINTPASCLGAPGFKSEPDDRLSWQSFSWFFSFPPSKFRDILN
jgi:hypothetical protein